MLTPIGLRYRRTKYFEPHPLHGTFALIACMAFAGLIAVAVLLSVAR